MVYIDGICVRIRLCAGASVVALAMVLVACLAHAGAWKEGRATFYGADEWSIHTGAPPRSKSAVITPGDGLVTPALERAGPLWIT